MANLRSDLKPTAQVAMKCGIYQRDALSPLLLCISLNPLIQIEWRQIPATEWSNLQPPPLYIQEVARKAATTKYLQRVRQVLKSQLNGKNKI